jgi:hypothetical protein
MLKSMTLRNNYIDGLHNMYASDNKPHSVQELHTLFGSKVDRQVNVGMCTHVAKKMVTAEQELVVKILVTHHCFPDSQL